MDGMELAKKIRALDADARIVFLTSYERYAVQGYRVRAYDFMLKDSYKKDLTDLLERVYQKTSPIPLVILEQSFYRHPLLQSA